MQRTSWGALTEERVVLGNDNSPDDGTCSVLSRIPWQCQVLESRRRRHRGLSVRSGHGVGETTLLSWVLLWFSNAVPVQGGGDHTLGAAAFDALWAELLVCGSVGEMGRQLQRPYK